MQLARAIIVKNVGENAGVTVEEKLPDVRIIIEVIRRVGLRQPGESSAGQGAQSAAVGLVLDSSDVDHDAILVVPLAHRVLL